MADKPGILLQQHAVFSHPCLCERSGFFISEYLGIR